MKPNAELTGRVAVVTGAAGGVGFALALQAADRGMRVALADKDEYALGAAVEQVRAKHVDAIAVRADMLDFAAVQKLARRSTAELGPPWLVCNSPGVSIQVNLWGVINGVQAFAPDLVKRGGGHVVNVVAAELFGTRGAPPYVAAAHAIVGLSEALYRELDLMGSQVGVTLVCPALVNTNIGDTPEYQKGGPSAPFDFAVGTMPPERMAEEIFAAVATRRFRVFPDARELQEMSGPSWCSAMSYSNARNESNVPAIAQKPRGTRRAGSANRPC